MPHTIGPPALSPSTSAERAKLIVERAVQETQQDITETAPHSKRGQKTPAPPPAPEVRAKIKILPDVLSRRSAPQQLEGRIVAVEGQNVTIETAQGRIEVRLEKAQDLQAGQKVEVTLPPDSRAGTVVQVQIQPPETDVPAYSPPPQSDATKDFPPVREHDILMATPRPIQDYIIPKYEEQPRQKIYTPHTLLKAVQETLDVPYPQTVAIKFPAPLMALTSRIKFDPVHLAINIARPPVPLPAGYIHVPPKMMAHIPDKNPVSHMEHAPDNIGNENVLTQAPLSGGPRPVETHPHTSLQASLFLTIQAAMLTGQDIPAPLPPLAANRAAAMPPSPLLQHFTQFDVLAVIPKNTPADILQQKVTRLLKTFDPEKPTASSKQPFLAQMEPSNGLPPAHPVMHTSLATVVGATPHGQTIISVPPPLGVPDGPSQLFYISTRIFAPIGSKMLLNLSEIPIGTLKDMPAITQNLSQSLQQNLTAGFYPATALPPPLWAPAFSPVWPAMDEALKTLNAAGLPTARSLQNTLPSPTPRMAATAMFFIAALKLGNIENWIGRQTLDALKQNGKTGLADRLSSDFGRLSAQASDTSSGPWKTITLPMLYEGEISNIQLHVRADDQQQQEQDNDDDQTAIKKTRFVLDLALSRMGALQIDGYLTPETLDIILRSDEKLAGTVRRDLMRIFAGTLETVGLKGGLAFQNYAQTRVKINETGKSY